MLTSNESSHDIQRITVIGAGPIGLAFIIAVLTKEKHRPNLRLNIDVIEKRDLNFIRGQKIILTQDESPVNGITWFNFCHNNFFPDSDLQLDIQGNLLIDGAIPENNTDLRYSFMQKILRQQKKSGSAVNTSIKKLQKTLLEHIKKTPLENVVYLPSTSS